MEGLPLSFDLKIFIFSIVNFTILFFVLKKFFFVPVYNILEERKKKVKESLNKIEQADEERKAADIEKSKIIEQASRESEKIIQHAGEMKKEILAKGQKEAEEIIKYTRESIDKEREDLRKEMNVLLVDLVSAAADKALLNISKEKSNSKMIETAILQSLDEASLTGEKK